MHDSAVDERLVDAVISLFGDHKDGTRPVHTLGIGVDAFFEPSDIAPTYCKAEHFQRRVRALVRFSNGLGSPVRHDGWSDVRGMATRFYLTDEKLTGTPDEKATDLIAMTLPEFYTPTVDDFFKFAEAARPQPARKESALCKLIDLLKLKAPSTDPEPGRKETQEPGALEYANHNRFSQLAVLNTGTIGAPESYARAAYHAVHTFIVTAKDGVRRPVRFYWQPVAGVRNTKAESPPVDDYLCKELRERLKLWPARFMLMMKIGEAGDALNDPTRPWPPKRIRVAMGTLTLKGIPERQDLYNELIAFNPCRLLPGIEVSDDPVLRARKGAYEASRKRRGGLSCPFHDGAADGK